MIVSSARESCTVRFEELLQHSLQCSCCTSHQVNTRRGWQPTRSPERDAGHWLTRSADLQAVTGCMWTLVRKQCRKKYFDLGSEFSRRFFASLGWTSITPQINQATRTPWRCLNVISFLVISKGTCWRIDTQNYQWRLQRFTKGRLKRKNIYWLVDLWTDWWTTSPL